MLFNTSDILLVRNAGNPISDSPSMTAGDRPPHPTRSNFPLVPTDTTNGLSPAAPLRGYDSFPDR